MELLWLAIVFYTVGLGAVLYIRPAIMFNENGTWKEFGYQRDSRHTIFPFWLFVITWAIISYMLSMIVSASMIVPAAAAVSSAHSFATSMFEEKDEEEDIIEMPDEEVVKPPRRRSAAATKEPIEESAAPGKEKPRPGYYILEEGAQAKGLRKYVYYGSNPPS